MCDYIQELVMRNIGVTPKEIGSDGHDRWQCPVCGEWWYGERNFCSGCGQRMKYSSNITK